MKRLMLKRNLNKWAILTSLATITLLLGHGCSDMASKGASMMSSSGGGPVGTTDDGSIGGGFTPIPGASTTSLIYNKQMVDNMVICTGIGTPSVGTLNEWKGRQSSFSEFGYATDVTAPMLMAMVAVAGEMCSDLLKLETVMPAANRRIFNSFDFSRGIASVDTVAVGDATRRLARSCWARNEDENELAIINEEILAAKSGVSGTDSAQTKNLALVLCTSMLASLSGITL